MSRAAIRCAVVALSLAAIPGSSRSVMPVVDGAGRSFFRMGPTSLFDPRLAEIRRASVSWATRTGPDRRVVDLVCLVPDLATFLEAIAAWDESQMFPILIDDADLSLKFLKAFRPTRIVTYSGAAPPIAEDQLWDRAVDAVGRSWVRESRARGPFPRGDTVPSSQGPTPPGIVVSAPSSATLAGAVALAAGRFQPLLRWEPSQGYSTVLEQAEAVRLADELGARIADRIPHAEQLGDDCDFITLAGDYPYRYRTRGGACAFDDLIGRSQLTGRRWAYSGRLIGSPAAAVYQAMCSLFLHPETALLFNAYSETEVPWSLYHMRTAAGLLGPLLPLRHRVGPEQTDIAGWHRAFDPINQFGFLLLNSSGYPRQFSIQGGSGWTADIPTSLPTVVVPIHSTSAMAPTDPDTIAGRWLANGAYLFYGSMNEPYLPSFRTPTLIASLIAEGLPLIAAVRQTEPETFGCPWRLVYFGDPLYRILPTGPRHPRLSWSVLPELCDTETSPSPPAQAPDGAKLEWARRTVLAGLRKNERVSRPVDPVPILLSIRRERLTPPQCVLYDKLLADRLEQPVLAAGLRAMLDQIPPGAMTPSLHRRLESRRMSELHAALADGDLMTAARAWDALIRSDVFPEVTTEITAMVARLANTRDRLVQWRNQLRSTREALRASPISTVVEEELRRVDSALVR
jgi:hypothetical protein